MLPERTVLLSWLYNRLKPKRFLHTLGVEELAWTLAQRFGEDPMLASTAALLHDCAKNMDDDDLIDILKSNGYNMKELRAYPQLYHSFAAPFVAQKEFGELPPEVLSAITYHTTGHVPMSKLDTIIFCADFAEPTRRPFPELEPARILLRTNLNGAAIYILESTFDYIREQGKSIYPLSQRTLDYLKEQKG